MRDRNPVQLVGSGAGAMMQRYLPPSPERDSIFGDTYDGVPNPQVPFKHPYPTRYHGPKFDYPQSGYTYRERTYVRAPYLGVDFLGYQARSMTSSTTLDAVIGAAAGYLMTPKNHEQHRLLFGLAGAALTGWLGTIGLVAIVGGSIYLGSKKPEGVQVP